MKACQPKALNALKSDLEKAIVNHDLRLIYFIKHCAGTISINLLKETETQFSILKNAIINGSKKPKDIVWEVNNAQFKPYW